MDSCPLCGSHDWVHMFPATADGSTPSADDYRCTAESYGVHGPIQRCRDCHLVFIADDLAANDIAACYEQVEDTAYVEEQPGRIATFARQLKTVETRHAKGALLEIGSYTGVFLSLARDSGWDVTGLEPSAWGVERARELHGLHLRQGSLRPGAVEPDSYDVAVMWDVIEHLADPVSAVSQLYAALKPGGLIGVSTMDITSLPARVSGAHWPWLMSMHRVYFSRATMRRLLEQVGFERIEIRPHVRRISIAYLAERMTSRLPVLGRTLGWTASVLRVDRLVVPFYMGDLFEAYAYKPLA